MDHIVEIIRTIEEMEGKGYPILCCPKAPFTLEIDNFIFAENASKGADVCRTMEGWDYFTAQFALDTLEEDFLGKANNQPLGKVDLIAYVLRNLKGKSVRIPTIDLNNNSMNMNNFKYIAGQLEDVGFDFETLNKIRTKVEAGEERIAETFRRRVEGGVQIAVPILTKHKEDDFYFLNAYRSTLVLVGADNKPFITEGITYVNKSHSHTLDEMEKILRGGSIEKEQLNKEQQPYVGWVTLDKSETDGNGFPIVRSFHPNYGFNDRETVQVLPFIETQNPALLDKLLDTMRKGLPGPVSREVDGKVQQYFIYHNVKYKHADIFHSDMKKLTKDERIALLGEDYGMSKNNDLTQGPDLGEGQSRGRGQGVPF